MYVTDLEHVLYLPEDAPGPARRLAEQTWAIVRAATTGAAATRWVSALPCRRRPGHRPCPGRIVVFRGDPPQPIEWVCSSCGDDGMISHWAGSPFDLHGIGPDPDLPTYPVTVSDATLTALRGIDLLDVDCEHAVFAARFDDGHCVLPVSDDVLDEIVNYVAGEANNESDRRRRRRLDAAYDELVAAQQNLPEPETRVPSSGLPEIDVVRVQRWCAARVPERVRHQVRVECDVTTEHVTIVECRAPRNPEQNPDWTRTPVARLRYTGEQATWTLYWRDRDLRFHRYDQAPPTRFVDELLTELDRDPTALFWG
ncbi:MAG: DUF3024 domain-containing protein [Rhodococcus sp. (in: high G+C Gram-positive bacteria)]|uniref:DUF3024 domain-containing protein n=1 Tax=Rhodococcus sp. TaxID=1831 RepID=UPI003BB5C99D